MLFCRIQIVLAINSTILSSPTVCHFFVSQYRTQHKCYNVNLAPNESHLFSLVPLVCLGNSVERQSHSETATPKQSSWVLFGNPFIHIYCQHEGMHKNKEFLLGCNILTSLRRGNREETRWKLWNILFVKMLLTTRERKGCEHESTKKKTNTIWDLWK